MAEILIGAQFGGAGFAVLAPVRRDVAGPARMWLSVPTGVCLYLIASLVLIVAADILDPAFALAVAGAAGVVGLLVAGARGDLGASDLKWAGGAIGIAIATVLLARLFHLTRLTPDSLRYLLGATDLVRPDALTEFSSRDLLNRQIGLPSLHTLSELIDRRYVTALGPLFGVFGLGLFAWFGSQVTSTMASRDRRWLLVGAVLFLGASNRLVYDVFYINTHIQMAMYILIAVVGMWLAVAESRTGWALPAGLALASILLLRPEAPIFVAVVLVTLAASRASGRVRLAMTIPSLVVVAVWYGLALWNHALRGDEISLTAPVFGSLVAVLGSALLVLFGWPERFRRVIGASDRVALAGFAVLLVGLGARDPGTVIDTAHATFRNLTWDGFWLLTWVAAVPLLIVALMVHRIPQPRLWTVPIVGFGLLWWLLPLIREGAWRVGAGDSGNRILAHIFPVVVAFLVLAAVEPNESADDAAGS
jgi:hypothetical protein